MGCIYIDGSGQVVFKQDAFLLNHGPFPKEMFQDDSHGCMNRCLLIQALQALCHSWGIYHKYFTDVCNKAFKKKIMWQRAFRVFFGSAPSAKNANTRPESRTSKTCLFNSRKELLAKVGSILGRKAVEKWTDAADEEWTRLRFLTFWYYSIWPFPQFILVNADVYWTNLYIMFNVYLRMYASNLWLLMYRMTRMMSEVLQRLIGSLSHRILSINSICAQCRM